LSAHVVAPHRPDAPQTTPADVRCRAASPRCTPDHSHFCESRTGSRRHRRRRADLSGGERFEGGHVGYGQPVGAPSSTYRLQITDDFTLTDAAAIVPYLTRLGIGAIYLSPILQSTTGSTHGYDTTDVTRIDAGRGGEDGFAALRAAASEHGLEVVVDIVPNHLGIEIPHENPAWWDVLRLGRDSAYADWF